MISLGNWIIISCPHLYLTWDNGLDASVSDGEVTAGKVCGSIYGGLAVEGQDLIAYLCYANSPHSLHCCLGFSLHFRAVLVACVPRSHVSGKMLSDVCRLGTEHLVNEHQQSKRRMSWGKLVLVKQLSCVLLPGRRNCMDRFVVIGAVLICVLSAVTDLHTCAHKGVVLSHHLHTRCKGWIHRFPVCQVQYNLSAGPGSEIKQVKDLTFLSDLLYAALGIMQTPWNSGGL